MPLLRHAKDVLNFHHEFLQGAFMQIVAQTIRLNFAQNLVLAVTTVSLFLLGGCSGSPKPAPKPENFLTLADLSGKPRMQEESPSVRVIRVKSKAFIKENNIRMAKDKALEAGSIRAVDGIVRELLSADVYNRKYDVIEQYMSTNLSKYILDQEVMSERKIFNGRYYGIAAAYKVNRQKVLVALQKDLKLIDTSSNTLITVVTSKKGIDLSSSGFTFSDVEDAIMNQLQTDLNQRGLRAMDFRNAVSSMQTDKAQLERFGKISKEQFMTMVSGSSANRALLDGQIQNAEKFYSTGLSLLKELSKVVLEVNIFSVSGNVKGDLALSFNVTAKNISTGRGGAFANTIINVARRGGPNVISSSMIAGLVKDGFEELRLEFIPQVIKEMSTVSVGGKRLMAYELVMKDFSKKDGRRLRTLVRQNEKKNFRYIDYDNSVPSIIAIRVRYSGSSADLGDKIMGMLDNAAINVEEPVVAPDMTDLVFNRLPDPQ